MVKSDFKSVFVTNESLFELKQQEILGIQKELSEYLLHKEFPWLSLGQSFTSFLHALISSHKGPKILGSLHPSVVLENPESIVVEAGAVVEPYAYLCGPVYIAPKATVRHGAYVRGSVYVGAHAIVGHTTECKGSILLPHAKASHFNYVGDSILGVETNLGAGTKLANLKINRSPISFHLDGKKVDTYLNKLGAILGNRAQTGCNAVTNPGTIMLPETKLLPNQTASGIIKHL